jgi:GNAT superfamily N-acetyltransferase
MPRLRLQAKKEKDLYLELPFLKNKVAMTGLKFLPLTKKNWTDFENLFGKNGACGGCWCMWWRIKRSEFEKNKGAGNKKLMKKIVSKGTAPGLIFYLNKIPIGWISVAPRDDFPVLNSSRVLKKIDDEKVWSIVCFFIDKHYRRKGISVEILKATINFAKKKKVKILEGYPVEPKKEKIPSVFAWTGFASAFLKAGFKEFERRSETRPIMRYVIQQ